MPICWYQPQSWWPIFTPATELLSISFMYNLKVVVYSFSIFQPQSCCISNVQPQSFRLSLLLSSSLRVLVYPFSISSLRVDVYLGSLNLRIIVYHFIPNLRVDVLTILLCLTSDLMLITCAPVSELMSTLSTLSLRVNDCLSLISNFIVVDDQFYFQPHSFCLSVVPNLRVVDNQYSRPQELMSIILPQP